MTEKIKCRDCGVSTWNRTERCGHCRVKWRSVNSSTENIKVVKCDICEDYYGITPGLIVKKNSIDCPFCAKNQGNTEDINGFKLPTAIKNIIK